MRSTGIYIKNKKYFIFILCNGKVVSLNTINKLKCFEPFKFNFYAQSKVYEQKAMASLFMKMRNIMIKVSRKIHLCQTFIRQWIAYWKPQKIQEFQNLSLDNTSRLKSRLNIFLILFSTLRVSTSVLLCCKTCSISCCLNFSLN